jgi:hypothetical protein
MVSGDRLVTIDLEQAFTSRRDLVPLVAKEIVAYLRSLGKGADPDTFRADIAAIVSAYPRPELLRATVREYLDNPNPLRRWMWSIDRRRRRAGRPLGKYAALLALRAALDPATLGA